MPIISNKILLNISRGNYKYIGDGSSRKVYDIGNKYVLKIAKNSAGIAQNKTEYYISSMDKSNLFAKVIKVYENFKFLIMEKAEKIYNISYLLWHFRVKNIDELTYVYEIQNAVQKYNLLVDDLKRQSSWGVINGKVVIIDYGYTREVKSIYYN